MYKKKKKQKKKTEVHYQKNKTEDSPTYLNL